MNYFYICKRKLWLFDKGITMEQNNDRVLAGKIIHEDSYTRQRNKEVLVDNLLKIDILDADYVHEVKITSKMKEADHMQLYYYLYYLKSCGIEKKGMLNYVKERKQEEIILTEDKIKEIEKMLIEIHEVTDLNKPPALKKCKSCTKCAYYEFCFAKEEDDG